MATTPEEKAMAARAVELGNSSNALAVPELLRLAESPLFHVQRLAVSGLGKLATVADAALVVPVLICKLQSSFAQIRQYAIKSLMAYGIEAQSALHDLRDIVNNMAEKDYNRKHAENAITVIETAVQIKEQSLERHCQKCHAKVDAGEYARSQKAFQRIYCDHCFDEVYLQRRNWDTNVELNKNIRAGDGTLVQSAGEKQLAEWLTAQNIIYRYDERIRIIEGYAVRPDFYLPEFDLYIEYWGMDTIDYKIGMLKKKKIYQMTGKKLISLYPDDRPNLDAIMHDKLKYYIFNK